jgi:hypothetical protein
VALTFLGLLVNIAMFLRVKHDIASSELLNLAFFALVMWLTVAVLVFTPAFRTRCSPLAMTLPLPATRLWLTHLLGVTLSGVVIFGVMGLVATGSLAFVARATEQAPLVPTATLLQLAASLVVTHVLAATLLQSQWPHLTEIRRDRRFAWLAMGAIVGGWGLATLLALVSPALLALPVVATVVIGRRAHRTLPRAFASFPKAQLSTAEGVDSGTAWQPQSERSSRGIVGFVAHAIYRAAPKSLPMTLFGIPGLLFFGLILAGVFDAFDDDGSAAFQWIVVPITVYMLLAFFAKPIKSLPLVDPLPVARPLLFAILAVPSVVLLCAGYGAGRLIVSSYGPNRGVDFTVVSSNCSGILVPYSLLRIAWNGEPPPIETPWGERHEPWQTPLYRGCRAVLYSPYCSRDTTASTEFVAQRTSLATEALYGARVPEAEIQARYLNAGMTRLTFRPHDPNLRIQHAWTTFPVLMLLVCCSWFISVAIYMRTFRGGVGDGVRKWTLVGLLVVLMALHIVQFVPFVLDITKPWIISAFWQIGARALVQVLPGGALTLWILCTGVIALFYWVAQRQFARAEFQVSSIPCLL